MSGENPLPGYMPRPRYMKEVHGKSDFTGRRWQQQGLLVIKYFGRTPFVDLVATVARMRGEDRPQRHKRRGG
jgi:hypothetical protein